MDKTGWAATIVAGVTIIAAVITARYVARGTARAELAEHHRDQIIDAAVRRITTR